MICDIIIPVWDQPKLTKECMESILRNTHYPYRLIIVDNGSDKPTAGYLNDLTARLDVGSIKIIRNEENLGFIKAVNQGLKESKAPYICIMNNDTTVTDGWLSEMIDIAGSNKDVGLVNPSSNNLGQHKDADTTIDEYASKLKRFKGLYMEMGSCVGFCMLIKKELFDKIRFFDEIYGSGNFDDTDYSRKAEREGYISVRAEGAYVHHHMNSSFLKLRNYEESFRKNQEIYNRRWGRPKRHLYIVTKDHDKLLDWLKEDIYRKARGGNWIWLFFRKTEELPRLAEHSNIKLTQLPHIFFELNCLVRILKKKKKFDSIHTDDPGLLDKIKRHNKIHKAETIPMGG